MILSSELKRLALDPAHYPLTWKELQQGVQDSVAPGFVVGVWEKKNSDSIHIGALGQRRTIPTPEAMHVDTIFDLASVSKVLATTSLCGLLVDRGWLTWDTPVKKIFPFYSWPNIQVRHLLSHTAGLPNWRPLWEQLWKRFEPEPIWKVSVADRQKGMRDLVFAVAPEAEVGKKVNYSDLTFLTLGFLMEEITQMPLDQTVEKFLFQPMGLSNSSYRHVTSPAFEDRWDDAAATEDCPDRGGVLQGQVHDDNCWAMGGYAGHTGVFTNVVDVLHFSRALFTERFLSAETLKALWTRASEPPECERTLGWDTPSGSTPSSGSLFSPRSVGHLGFTGTSLWIDLDAELAVALLSNRVHPSRENIKIRDFRPRFHDAIRRDLANRDHSNR